MFISLLYTDLLYLLYSYISFSFPLALEVLILIFNKTHGIAIHLQILGVLGYYLIDNSSI